MDTRENKERGTGNRERPETLADVIKEFRECAEAAARRGPIDELGAATAALSTTFADRIDAASGNAAAMREALEAVLDECCNLCDVPNQMTESGHTCSWRNRWPGCQSKAIDKARAALARNCDRFGDDDDAFAAWHEALNDGDVVSVRNAFRWLFSRTEGGAE